MRSTITEKGRELLAKLQLGEISMEFSSAKTGSGTYTSDESISARNSLKIEKNSYTFSSMTEHDDGILLSSIFSNVDPVSGDAVVLDDYRVNEIGLYVTVDGESNEYLYIIAVCDGNTGNIMPGYDGTNPIQFIESFKAHMSTGLNVTVNYEGAAALASDLGGKADNLSYDAETDTLSLKSGTNVLSSVTIDSGTQIKVGDVSGATAITSTTNITLKWSDPSDTTSSEGVILAKWKGTKVVRKTGSAPTSLTDGTIVVNNTTRNQYSSSGFTDTSLEYDTTYYYRFFPYTEDDIYTDGSAVSAIPTRITIASVPTQSGTIQYDGSTKTATWNGFNSDQLTVSGDTGSAVGSYTATFTPKEGYQWWDETLTAKTATWSISKGTGAFTKDKTSVTLDSSNLTQTVTCTVTGDGTISAQSSDTSVATTSVSGNVVTISHVIQTSGTATVTISLSETSNYTGPADQTISVTASFVAIYGAEWDGTSTTAWSRTDASANFTDPVPAVNGGTGSSPFDNCSPWKDMTIVDDSNAGKVVKIPKFYYKWTRTGSKMKLQIADGYVSGFYVSPAHADRGDGKGERDFVYVGRYHCGASNYKSVSGVKPEANHTRAEFRSSIHNLGSTIWQWDYATLCTIQMLYLVEFADWNSQAKIGYGCGNNSGTENMGSTDSMQYHTGTMAANRTTYTVGIQYRYIEGLWSNVLDWCDGIYFSSANVYCIKNPANFSDTANGTLVGTSATSSNYISACTTPTASGFEYAIYPNAVSGSESTYVCDYCYYSASGVVLFVGGNYSQGQNHGLFYLGGNVAATNKGAAIGSRLQKLP